ncbi:hypothetical protein HZA42_02750 [Candidatus Peregrinibacteria bacterium]|nr:hypothetical protein [Candidatus Peregrinibacteria bacterium]
MDAPYRRINGLGRPCMGMASSLGLTSLWLGLILPFENWIFPTVILSLSKDAWFDKLTMTN